MLSIPPIDGLVRDIAALPEDWHDAGSVPESVLRTLVQHAQTAGPIRSSLETGTGRTTLLLSHLSDSHLVFTKEDTGDGDSYSSVTSSPLLRRETVQFVIGPTQRTLPVHEFTAPLDLALIDGPHAYPFPDLEYWVVYPQIRPGGLLVVDDIQIPTITNLYRFLSADAMWREIAVVDKTAFFTRTEAPGIDPYGEGWWLQGFNTTTLRPTRLDRLRSTLAIRTRLRHLITNKHG
jgi:predicted O-methyltransferase YrrM